LWKSEARDELSEFLFDVQVSFVKTKIHIISGIGSVTGKNCYRRTISVAIDLLPLKCHEKSNPF